MIVFNGYHNVHLNVLIWIFQVNEEMVTEALESKEPGAEEYQNLAEQAPEGTFHPLFIVLDILTI